MKKPIFIFYIILLSNKLPALAQASQTLNTDPSGLPEVKVGNPLVGDPQSSAYISLKNWVSHQPYSLVLFKPDIGSKSKNAEIMIYALDQYFAKGYSLHQQNNKLKIPVAIVYKNNSNNVKFHTQCTFIPDSGQHLLSNRMVSSKAIDIYGNTDHDATLILLDSSMTIRAIRNYYDGTGELLRPFEKDMRTFFKSDYVYPTIANLSPIHLKVGDTAPSFDLGHGKYLSDLKGKTVVLSFYPAPFTGLSLNYHDTTRRVQPIIKPSKSAISNNKVAFFGCGGQAIYIDRLISDFNNHRAERHLDSMQNNNNIVTLYVSSSNDSMLQNWADYLGTKNILYLNDEDYKIAIKYNTYNGYGYNYRSLFIIDRSGIIRHIDLNFGQPGHTIPDLKQYVIE